MTSIKEIRKHSSSYYEPKREVYFDFFDYEDGSSVLIVCCVKWSTKVIFPIKKFLWWETLGVPYDNDNKDVPVFLAKTIREWLEECYLHSVVGYTVNGEEI